MTTPYMRKLKLEKEIKEWQLIRQKHNTKIDRKIRLLEERLERFK